MLGRQGSQVEEPDMEQFRMLALWRSLTAGNRELGLVLLEQLRDRQEQ